MDCNVGENGEKFLCHVCFLNSLKSQASLRWFVFVSEYSGCLIYALSIFNSPPKAHFLVGNKSCTTNLV